MNWLFIPCAESSSFTETLDALIEFADIFVLFPRFASKPLNEEAYNMLELKHCPPKYLGTQLLTRRRWIKLERQRFAGGSIAWSQQLHVGYHRAIDVQIVIAWRFE